MFKIKNEVKLRKFEVINEVKIRNLKSRNFFEILFIKIAQKTYFINKI